MVLLIALLISSSSLPGRVITESRILWHGDCRTATYLDVALHLLINIFSTCVLASSNFFMQIVSSPTRKELDCAHRSFHALEIGVSSFKNLGSLSWFKVITWAGLFLSSVPIHLLFNSAIYSTEYTGANWQLTIATQSFVNGTVDYFLPGTSLAAGGTSCPFSPNEANTNCTYPNTPFPKDSMVNVITPSGSSGYGLNLTIKDTDDWDGLFENRNVTNAAESSSTWDVLEPAECYDEYRFCKPRQKYRDLVVVVDTPSGWNRSEVYNFNDNIANNLSEFWNAHIPPDHLNSLWYSTSCSVWRLINGATHYCDSSTHEYVERLQKTRWDSTGCAGALGELRGIDWVNTSKLDGSWTFSFRPDGMIIPDTFGYNDAFNDLTVQHCRAEPNPDYVCKVGLASLLLVIVIGCIFVKTIICGAILWFSTHHSLVIPGDAVSSFISRPDLYTRGLGTLGITDSDRLEYKSIEKLPENGLLNGPQARRWKRYSPRFKSVLSWAVWVRTYSILTVGIILLSAALGVIISMNGASSL